MHRRLLALATALCLAACTTPDDTTPTSTPSPTNAPTPTNAPHTDTPTTPTPTATPTPWQSFEPTPTNATDDQRAIRAGWEAYQQEVDRYLKDPSIRTMLPLQGTIAQEFDQTTLQSIFRVWDAGLKREGNMRFRDIVVSAPESSPDGTRTATVSFCADFRQQRLVDAKTGEPRTDDQLDSFPHTNRMKEIAPGRWVVAADIEQETRPC